MKLIKITFFILAACAILAAGAFALKPASATGEEAGQASALGVEPIWVAVEPIFAEGNPTCQQMGYDYGFKVDPPTPGTYSIFIGGIETVTVTSDGVYFDWTSTLGMDAVIAKGGPNGNIYIYDPPEESFEDADLHSPINTSTGKPYGLSHIEFCYDLELSAKKTAEASYKRTYEWEIAKEYDGEYSKFIGESATNHGYNVSVDQTATDSDWTVSGAITIYNPAPFEVQFSVEDFVDGVKAEVECPTDTLAAFETLECSYEATLTGAVDGTNTATITSLTEGIAGATAQAGYVFGAPEVVGYPNIHVTDSNGQAWEAGGDDDWDYTKDFVCPKELNQYIDGYYKIVHENTATITETGQSDTAVVTVHCYAPVVTKDAETSFDRSWKWEIDKVGSLSAHTLSPGQFVDVVYDVTVDASPEDSGHKVSGTITVTNPHPTQSIIVMLSDTIFPDQIIPLLECADGLLDVPGGESATCDYSADLPDGASRENKVTVFFNGLEFYATAEVIFGDPKTESGICVDVYDDKGVSEDWKSLGTLCSNKDELPYTFNYTRPVGGYKECGAYQDKNIARLMIGDNPVGEANWVVDINVPCGGCTLTPGYWKTHSKYGPAPYDDTWALVGEDTTFFQSGKSYYEVLSTPPSGGNAYYILAHAYIAAKLNGLNGASLGEVQAAFDQATDLFLIKTPEEIAALKGKIANAQRAQFISLAGILDDYNNGLTGPGHCVE